MCLGVVLLPALQCALRHCTDRGEAVKRAFEGAFLPSLNTLLSGVEDERSSLSALQRASLRFGTLLPPSVVMGSLLPDDVGRLLSTRFLRDLSVVGTPVSLPSTRRRLVRIVDVVIVTLVLRTLTIIFH